MPKTTPHNDIQEEIEKAIGLEREKFFIKIKALRKKWEKLGKEDEYEETRIISPYLFNKRKITPVNTSILSDNLEYFKNNYKKEYGEGDLVELLEVACLSGSKMIADFLLKKLGKTYVSEDCQFVLNYAAASFNIDWVKEIANEVSRQEIIIPDHIYSNMNSPEVINEIVSIFSVNQRGNRPFLTF